MEKDNSDIRNLIKQKEDSRKKPVDTEMYWWLNKSREFFINDDYKICLEKIDKQNKSVKIKIINLKAAPLEVPTVKLEDSSLDSLDFLDTILGTKT